MILVLNGKKMKRKYSLITIFTLALIIFFSCSRKSQNETKTAYYLNDKISFEKTVCFGTCPVYNMTIYGNGKISYTGSRFVKKSGTHELRAKSEDLKQLFDHLYNMEFDKLKDRYDTNVTDIPSTIINYKKKTVVLRWYAYAPESLRELDRILINIAEKTGYIK